MKKLFVFIIMLLFLITCRKDIKEERNFGWRPDDPARVAQIPLIMSEEMTRASKGKPGDKDGDGFTSNKDCNDNDVTVYPGANEICDGKDNNCNGVVDENCTPPPPPVLPSNVELITPIPMNQGNEGSCVPFSSVYAARSIEQYYRTGASSYNISTNIFSPEYVYDYTKFQDCGSGTAITTTLDLMYNKGVCLWQTLPYSDTNGCDSLIAKPFDEQAAAYKIPAYSRVYKEDITAIKTMLFNKHPLITSVLVDNGFIAAGPGYIWSAENATDGFGPHTVAIVGYDDTKHAYKIINSWGTGWCDGGFGWIDYDFFPTKAGFYVYVMNY